MRVRDSGPALVFSDAPTVAARFSALASREQEEFWVLLLDSRHREIRRCMIHRGGLSRCEVFARDVFREAVRCNASAVILVHNHPSGDPDPSPDDVQLTRRLVAAGRVLGVAVLDHVVVASEGFRSLEGRVDMAPRAPTAADFTAVAALPQ